MDATALLLGIALTNGIEMPLASGTDAGWGGGRTPAITGMVKMGKVRENPAHHENIRPSDTSRGEAATIWSLQTGPDAVKNRHPSREQVASLLLDPMRWPTDKFAGGTRAGLAKIAIQSLKYWLF